MGRVGDFGDVLICKVVRNISQWTFGEQRMITHATEHRELIKDQRRRIKRAERAARKGDTPEEDESGRRGHGGSADVRTSITAQGLRSSSSKQGR